MSASNVGPDPQLSLGFAQLQDAAHIRGFVRRFWNSSHVLSESGELLRWNHLDRERAQLNFVCARFGGELVSILGFIPTSHFDSAIPFGRDVWLVMWKAREDVRIPGLGISLLQFVRRELSPRTMYSVGNNDKVALLYRLLGFELLDLTHYYRANPTKQNFRLLSGNIEHHDWMNLPDVSWQNAEDRLDDFRQVVEGAGFSPFKTIEYVRNRYVRHPFYKYQLKGVWRKGLPIALLVARVVRSGSSAAVRIVDLFGSDENLAYMGSAVDDLVREADAEYADFYGYGYENVSLAASGLVAKAADTVVPNYFEPFSPMNVPIHCAVLRSATDPIRIVRADSDQDRPNLLPYSE